MCYTHMRYILNYVYIEAVKALNYNYKVIFSPASLIGQGNYCLNIVMRKQCRDLNKWVLYKGNFKICLC